MKIPTLECEELTSTDGILRFVEDFDQAGCLLIRNAFDPGYLSVLRQDLEKSIRRRSLGIDRALVVGDKRLMHSVAMEGVWNTPELYANKYLMPLLNEILGKDLIVGSLVGVISNPGSETQHIHRDYSSLYQSETDLSDGPLKRFDSTPPFAVTLFIPLIEQNGETGNTRLWPGSHRNLTIQAEDAPDGVDYEAAVGDCLLVDYRILHSGCANRSSIDRPLITLVYYRWWFRDTRNYHYQKPLRISRQALRNVPQEYRTMFGGRRLNPSGIRLFLLALRKMLPFGNRRYS